MFVQLMLWLFSQIFVLVLLDRLLIDALTNHVQDNISGPCIIRRTQLPRLEAVKVGHVQHIQLIPSGKPHLVTTLSVDPPIFEIPDFLLVHECNHVIKLAKNQVMESSDIYQPNGNLSNHYHHISFHEWDQNGDGLLSKNEIYEYLLYLKDIHVTEKDIMEMCKALGIGRVKEGFIHPSEFNASKIMKYFDKLVAMDTSIKGRHSNNTWLEMPNDDVVNSLNLRKAVLTGLPLEIIQGSEPHTVIKYGQGGHYHCHYDSHRHDNMPCCNLYSVDNCRVCRYITIMYYLNDVQQGGQTAFPFANKPSKQPRGNTHNVSNLSAYCSKANLVITPKRGKAVMWYNHVINEKGTVGNLDPSSYHGGCDVIEGEKWIMNNWINVIGDHLDNLNTWDDGNGTS